MTGPGSLPVDVLAILTDLQQQLSDLTGIVAAQQRTLSDLTLTVNQLLPSPDHGLLPDGPVPAPVLAQLSRRAAVLPTSPGGA